MHMLARNFALQLKQEISKDANKAEQYGEHVKYQKIFWARQMRVKMSLLKNW